MSSRCAWSGQTHFNRIILELMMWLHLQEIVFVFHVSLRTRQREHHLSHVMFSWVMSKFVFVHLHFDFNVESCRNCFLLLLLPCTQAQQIEQCNTFTPGNLGFYGQRREGGTVGWARFFCLWGEYHIPVQHRLHVRPIIRPIQSLAAQLKDWPR